MSEWFSSCVFCAAGLFRKVSVFGCRLSKFAFASTVKLRFYQGGYRKPPICDLLSPQSSQ